MGKGAGRTGQVVPIGVALGATAMLVVPASSQAPAIADQHHALVVAKAATATAERRAGAIAAAAAGERDAARHVRVRESAAAARVVRAESDLAAARARVALVGRLLADQRARLTAQEAPVARLMGGLASLARRPALAGIAQPGSVNDLVHLRAVLGSAIPAIRVRTAGIRAQLDATRALEADAALAADALAGSRRRLENERLAFVALEARHDGRAIALDRSALAESDRAIALGERARDIVDAIAATGGQQVTRTELETLPGPPLPIDARPATRFAPVYRLPASGRLVTGFGEVSAAGVRSRGLTLAVAPAARVVAPAGGRVAYAGRFRGYGAVVILDHGAGWTSLVTGLDRVAVARGAGVVAGTPLGIAAGGEEPRITVELRRRGRPVDLAALL